MLGAGAVPSGVDSCWCGSREFAEARDDGQYLNLTPPERHLLACLGCGARRRVPPLRHDTAVSHALPADISPANHYTAGDTLLARHLTARLRRAAVRCSAKRLLDVGAGNGLFLKHARTAGWDVLGLEADERSVCSIRGQGLACRQGTIESLPADTAPFGLVHMNHVLEHMEDPLSACAAARNLLRSPGALVVEVPNELASVKARLRRALGRRSSSATSFLQHQWFFDAGSLRELLTAAGFARVEVRTASRLHPVRIPRLPLTALGLALGMGDVIEAWAWTADGY